MLCVALPPKKEDVEHGEAPAEKENDDLPTAAEIAESTDSGEELHKPGAAPAGEDGGAGPAVGTFVGEEKSEAERHAALLGHEHGDKVPPCELCPPSRALAAVCAA